MDGSSTYGSHEFDSAAISRGVIPLNPLESALDCCPVKTMIDSPGVFEVNLTSTAIPLSEVVVTSVYKPNSSQLRS